MKKKNYSFKSMWKWRLSLLSALAFLSASICLADDVTTGLVARYSFDAVSGTTVTDDTGNGIAGTLVGAPAVVTGKSGSAVNFPTKTDYMTLPAGVVSTLTDFTISTWVNFNTLSTWSRIFDFGTGTSYYMFLTPSNGSIARFAIKNGGTEQLINGTAKLPTGKWVHVAVTCKYDPTTLIGTGKLYVNGSLVGTNSNLTINPSMLPSTTLNYLAKSQYNDPALNGAIDEFRIYNRALTSDEVMILNGYSSALISSYNNLTLGDVTGVTSNLTLPTASDNSVQVAWSSSNTAVVANDGTITRPDQFDATVVMTATLTQTIDGVTYTLTKTFNVTVKAKSAAEDIVANWDFDNALISTNASGNTVVKSNSTYAFEGTVMNNASIRRIGTTNQYNVLYTGNGTGYFDMGTEIGKAIYSLKNFSVCGFYRVDDDYSTISGAGNFFCNFSNSADVTKDLNGYIICPLNNQSYSITSSNYSAQQGVSAAKAATIGGWHHFAYTQNGTTGTIFVDGVQQSTGTVTALPSITLPVSGRTGTLYNWLGRSCYPSDSYLKKTMIYGFQVLNMPLSIGDLTNGYGDFEPVTTTISNLNAAYAENPNALLPELTTEQINLNLGDLSAVTSNLTLPTKGSLDNAIAISWKSSNDSLITSAGVVTCPNYFNYTDSLTATLSKNGQVVTKTFYATVLAKSGTTYNNDLLVKFDFSNVTDSVVTDVAEKGLKGILKKNAMVKTIGTSAQFKILSLGDSIGYFDMGKEVGKLMYNLSDYTMSAYYRIEDSYTGLTSNGNFLWSFSNGANALSDNNGYVIGSLKDLSQSITPYNYKTQNQTVTHAAKALTGGWHNLTYVQSGTTGNLYIDGIMLHSGTITNFPSTVLPKVYSNRLGTWYNWIGRSCYTGDVYLRKTLVTDFRIYKRALTDAEVQTDLLNVFGTIPALDVAYSETPISSVKSVVTNRCSVFSVDGGLQIKGLTGVEKVAVYDLTGRKLQITNASFIPVKSGIYIVKIDNFVTKALVK
ncbi:LamG domain-containing protein [Parabacteroides sp. FAFU027]|uniref:LamG domain-containing protein n=1 Tax=Parabacteroides sp. FAFU027 TaxID=2922715 RepID=UPI001FAF23E7|nr:LamG domain-containing protein [Parabacteroides sp. FAFU027]